MRLHFPCMYTFAHFNSIKYAPLSITPRRPRSSSQSVFWVRVQGRIDLSKNVTRELDIISLLTILYNFLNETMEEINGNYSDITVARERHKSVGQAATPAAMISAR